VVVVVVVVADEGNTLHPCIFVNIRVVGVWCVLACTWCCSSRRSSEPHQIKPYQVVVAKARYEKELAKKNLRSKSREEASFHLIQMFMSDGVDVCLQRDRHACSNMCPQGS